LHREGLLAACRWLPPRVATDEELLRCHTAAHVASVDGSVDSASARPDDSDMYASAGTPLAARLAAGCVTDAALCVGRWLACSGFVCVLAQGGEAHASAAAALRAAACCRARWPPRSRSCARRATTQAAAAPWVRTRAACARAPTPPCA
jgi:hypothetical protein